MTLAKAKRHSDLEAERFFRFTGAKTSKSLKKSRAARAMEVTSDHRSQDLAVGNGKSEDPAKMTHSIPDFVSRS